MSKAYVLSDGDACGGRDEDEDGDGDGDRRRVDRICKPIKRARDVNLRNGSNDRQKCLPTITYRDYV